MKTEAVSLWKLGDFHVIGASQVIVGEMLCDDADLTAGNRVLDVACGSGNTALAAARRGNRVAGLDLVDALVDRAKSRTAAEGFGIDYYVGNAQELPFEDAEFDVVLSTFGAMFAPDQERTADEMLRVCKRGGTIGMANWTPESLPGALFSISAKYAGASPGARSPIEWGSVTGLQRLFGGKVRSIRLVDRCIRHRFVSTDEWVETFRTYFGPVENVFDILDDGRAAEYEKELRQAVERYNRATDGTLAAAMSYVNVVIRTAG